MLASPPLNVGAAPDAASAVALDRSREVRAVDVPLGGSLVDAEDLGDLREHGSFGG